MRKLKQVKPGDPISATAWNELVGEVSRLSSMIVSPPLELVRGSGAPLIRLGSLGSLSSAILYGKLTSPLARGSFAAPEEATVFVWRPDGSGPGKIVNTTEERTVYDVGWMLSAFSPRPSDSYIRIHEYGPFLYYLDHNCQDVLI